MTRVWVQTAAEQTQGHIRFVFHCASYLFLSEWCFSFSLKCGTPKGGCNEFRFFFSEMTSQKKRKGILSCHTLLDLQLACALVLIVPEQPSVYGAIDTCITITSLRTQQYGALGELYFSSLGWSRNVFSVIRSHPWDFSFVPFHKWTRGAAELLLPSIDFVVSL